MAAPSISTITLNGVDSGSNPPLNNGSNTLVITGLNLLNASLTLSCSQATLSSIVNTKNTDGELDFTFDARYTSLTSASLTVTVSNSDGSDSQLVPIADSV